MWAFSFAETYKVNNQAELIAKLGRAAGITLYLMIIFFVRLGTGNASRCP